MAWHQTRQTVIAENIANANTPSYQAKELSQPDFKAILERQRTNKLPAGALSRTSQMHIGGQNKTDATTGAPDVDKDWETTPSGNSVVLEEQMMKLAENQLDYQTITALYSKSIKLMKMAVGK